MKIRLLIVGKIVNSHIKALSELYEKRVERYVSLEIDVIKSEKIKATSTGELLDREGEKILSKLSARDYSIILDKAGKQCSSEAFSQFFQRLANQSQKQISFIIGGPLGLADKVKEKAQEQLSLSKMTFPHELATVLLLEQIYRAHSILHGEPYHK